MIDALIVDAVRTPAGRRGGALANRHPVDLLALTLRALVDRNRLDPGSIDDVIAGCVSQAGEQSLNIARNALLGGRLRRKRWQAARTMQLSLAASSV